MAFSEQNFIAVIQSLQQRPNNINRCPDQYVGDVVWEETGFEYLQSQDFNRRNLDALDEAALPQSRLIIVMESPHIDEYNSCPSCGDRTAIGPANGVSGRNIREYLPLNTRDFALGLRGICYGLILVNAVPYQCSLGRLLSVRKERKTRDEVFRGCWNAGASNDFADRMSRYVNDQTLLVNACTKGETKGGRRGRWLRELVEDAIPPSISDSRRLRRCHPSSYHWTKGRPWF